MGRPGFCFNNQYKDWLCKSYRGYCYKRCFANHIGVIVTKDNTVMSHDYIILILIREYLMSEMSDVLREHWYYKDPPLPLSAFLGTEDIGVHIVHYFHLINKNEIKLFPSIKKCALRDLSTVFWLFIQVHKTDKIRSLAISLYCSFYLSSHWQKKVIYHSHIVDQESVFHLAYLQQSF